MSNRILVGVLTVIWLAGAAGRAAGQELPFGHGPHPSEVLRVKAEHGKARERLAVAKQAVERAQSDIRAIQDSLREKTGRMDISYESLGKAAARMEGESEALQLDAAGGEARMEALQKTIAIVTDRAQAAADRDDVATELAVVVAVRQKELAAKQALSDQHGISQLELESAKATVAEAKARLAERRLAVIAGAGGGGLNDWNRELLNLSLDAQERRARTKFLEAGLERLRSAMPLLDMLETHRERQREAMRELDAARGALVDAEREYERFLPFITPATQPATKGAGTAPGAP